MEERSVTTAQARKELADLLNRVAYGKETVILTRHGRELAALVPVEELTLWRRLRQLLRRREVVAALREVEEEGAVDWEWVRSELDL